ISILGQGNKAAELFSLLNPIYRIDVCGDDVGLHLVAVYVCARGGAVDRIEEREQLRRLVPLPEDCVRDHRPGGGVSVLPAVFPDTGRIALDVDRKSTRLNSSH